MRVTSKGQVTIPIHIRQELDIGPESEVEFEIVGHVVHLRKVKGGPSRGRRVVAALRSARYGGPSTDELMALTSADR